VSQVVAGSIERPEAPKFVVGFERPEAPKFVVGFARSWWHISFYTVRKCVPYNKSIDRPLL